jgi:hypothetical protein
MLMRRVMSRWQCGQMMGRASSPRSGIAYSCRASSKPTSAPTRVGQQGKRPNLNERQRALEGLGAGQEIRAPPIRVCTGIADGSDRRAEVEGAEGSAWAVGPPSLAVERPQPPRPG